MLKLIDKNVLSFYSLFYKYISRPMLFLFKDPGEVMFIKGSLTTQRFLTAVDMADSSLTEEVSRQLWMRIWSRVRGLWVSTFRSFSKAFHKGYFGNCTD